MQRHFLNKPRRGLGRESAAIDSPESSSFRQIENVLNSFEFEHLELRWKVPSIGLRVCCEGISCPLGWRLYKAGLTLGALLV